MVAHKITDEQLISEINAGLNYSLISQKYGISYRNLLSRIKRLDIKKPENLHSHIKGTSTLYDRNGNITQQWVKTSIPKEEQLQILKNNIFDLIKKLPKLNEPEYKEKANNSDLMAVYPLGDPHIGMLAWDNISGEEWNLKIAEDVFIKLFDRIVKSTPNCKKAVILNLGDLFHYDNIEGMTSRSKNLLDKDGFYPQMVQIAVKIVRRLIESALSHHEIVEVINLPGNHDDVGSVFLTIFLKHVYEDCPRLIINESFSVFHYIQFGKTLIGAHHGHSCPMDRLPGVMASDKAKEWGESKFRYWLTGHIHKDMKNEYAGCTVESFRTLAAKDSYAATNGYRSGRDIKSLIFHKEYGEIERHTVSIMMYDADNPS